MRWGTGAAETASFTAPLFLTPSLPIPCLCVTPDPFTFSDHLTSLPPHLFLGVEFLALPTFKPAFTHSNQLPDHRAAPQPPVVAGPGAAWCQLLAPCPPTPETLPA